MIKKNKWEKIFLIGSISVILICILFYGSRLVYYYMIEHPKRSDNSLKTKITKEVVYSGDGLYSKDLETYYYYGSEVDNYILFEGIVYRIIEINDKGIKIISDESLTSLAIESDNYQDSYINMWLNKIDNNENSGIFINNIVNQDYLVKSDYCIDKIDFNNPSCNDNYSNYVGLLAVSDYMRAGGSSSYLNNNSYFWTSNMSLDGRLIYVFNDGGIDDLVNDGEYYFSYGVRPVITLVNYLDYVDGDGSKSNPYIISERSIDNTQDMYVGEYIKINDKNYRVINKYQDSIKIIYDNVIEDKYSYYDGINYLKSIVNDIDSNIISKCDFYKGNYGDDSYDYRDVYNDVDNNYIGYVSVGDLFINSYSDYWLYNGDGSYDMFYKTNIENKIILDDKINSNKIRYGICIRNNIKINDGDGSINNPYILGE